MEKKVYTNWETIHINNAAINVGDDAIASEFPLTIVVNEREFATIVCTPQDLDEMVIGFLASEGIILVRKDIKTLHLDKKQGFAYVTLHKQLQPRDLNPSQRFIGSCCGKSRQFYFKSDVRTARTMLHSISIPAKQCMILMATLQAQSKHFKQTGGVHNAALCTTNELLEIRTDIGRHNTLDKLNGYIIDHHISVKDKLIVFSGRISSEVLLKVSKMGISILISASAPTDLALQLANDLGITAIGFTRNDKMNIYTHPERITGWKQ